MSTYETMPFHLETARLFLRPWAESDAVEFRDLLAERGNGTSTVENTRASIAKLLTATATTGIALLPIQRRAEGDFIGYCGLIIGRSTVDEPEIAYELFQRAWAWLRHRGGQSGPRRRDRDGAETALVNRRRVEHAVVACTREARVHERPRFH